MQFNSLWWQQSPATGLLLKFDVVPTLFCTTTVPQCPAKRKRFSSKTDDQEWETLCHLTFDNDSVWCFVLRTNIEHMEHVHASRNQVQPLLQVLAHGGLRDLSLSKMSKRGSSVALAKTGRKAAKTETPRPWCDLLLKHAESTTQLVKQSDCRTWCRILLALRPVLRSFDPDKDEHPVQWLLDAYDPSMLSPMCLWIDGILQTKEGFCPKLDSFTVPVACPPQTPSNLEALVDMFLKRNLPHPSIPFASSCSGFRQLGGGLSTTDGPLGAKAERRAASAHRLVADS